MFKKSFSLIAIQLVLSFCISETTGFYRFGSYPIDSCEGNPTYYGYCIDCENEQDCVNGEDGNPNVCSASQACQVQDKFAFCAENSAVPDCNCPPGESLQKPDPYDNTKYLVCENGVRHLFACPGGEIYDDTTELCIKLPSTTTFPCPDGDNIKVEVNCTCYRNCYEGGGYSKLLCCDVGTVFIDENQGCEPYEFFSCLSKPNGKYGDPHDCTLYYTCINEAKVGTGHCPDDSYFNDATGFCDISECTKQQDCGVCPYSGAFIKVDCFSYYRCIENPDYDPNTSSPAFIPEGPEECPEGTCFDTTTTFCELVGI